MSGCAYALAAAASVLGDEDIPYTRIAKRCCEGILNRIVYENDEVAYIADPVDDEQEGGRLGTTALLLIALLHLHRATGCYESEIRALLNGIRSAQEQSGMFRCCFGNLPASKSSIDFFPGQALLALVIGTEWGFDTCRDAYRKAFKSHRDHFRCAPTTAFVGWHAEVWSRAAKLEDQMEYAQFAFEQVDWLLQFQLVTDKESIYYGGFERNNSRPNSSSIVFTEAVVRAASLAHSVGDLERFERYRAAFEKGLQFCSRLRLTKAQSAFFASPERAIGGVVRGITNFEVRADVVQHMITLCVALQNDPHILLRN
jgi:hypothetical protein